MSFDVLGAHQSEAGKVSPQKLARAYGRLVRHTAIAPRHETSRLTLPEVQEVLSPQGEWKPRIDFNGQDPYSLKPTAIMDIFAPFNRAIYRVVDASLNEERDTTVFHRHDTEHIDRVAERGVQLVRDAGLDAQTTQDAEKLVTYMAIAHDWANFLNRREHAQYSAQLLAVSAPELQANPRFWHMIQRAIELHDSSSEFVNIRAEHFFDYWLGNATQPPFSPSDKELADDPLFRVAFCSFYLADKLDFGKERISKAVDTPEKLFVDPHNFVDAFGHTNGIYLQNSHIIWEIGFSQQLSDEQHQQYGFIPTNQPVVADQQNWEQQFFALHGKRTPSKAALALFPQATEFVIRIVSSEDTGTSSQPKEYIFGKEQIAHATETVPQDI